MLAFHGAVVKPHGYNGNTPKCVYRAQRRNGGFRCHLPRLRILLLLSHRFTGTGVFLLEPAASTVRLNRVIHADSQKELYERENLSLYEWHSLRDITARKKWSSVNHKGPRITGGKSKQIRDSNLSSRIFQNISVIFERCQAKCSSCSPSFDSIVPEDNESNFVPRLLLIR